MLNFDMIGSPNGMRGVYDGDSAPEEINAMSVAVQRMFGSWITLLHTLSLTIFPFAISSLNPYIAAIYPTPLFLSLPHSHIPFFPLFYIRLSFFPEQYLTDNKLTWTPTEFSGRSDYGKYCGWAVVCVDMCAGVGK